MEQILLLQNPHWQGKTYAGLVPRQLEAKLQRTLPLKEVQVLLGVRRSGKSTLFKLLINFLMKEQEAGSILYLNLDDPFFVEICDDPAKMYHVVELAEKLSGRKIRYLFLDEVQNVSNWQKFVKSVYDAEIFTKIFITGSNSSLLRGEYATLLAGRYVRDHVFPFSLDELLAHRGFADRLSRLGNKARLMGIIDDLLEYGGFPEVTRHESAELKREILLGYFDTILLKDCISQGKIRDVRTFKALALYLISNNGTLYSYSSLARAVGSNENTVKEFVHIMESSFLLKEITGFSFSLKTQNRGRKKTYLADNGLLANISFRFSGNKGKLLENLVFTELARQGAEIYFFNQAGVGECDFIIRKDGELTAIQVCYELHERNRPREIKGIRIAQDKLNIEKVFILTYDQNLIVDDVQCLPVWNYFAAS